MKICMVCYPTAGGSGVVATELALNLVSRGHDVHVVATETPFRMGKEREGLHFHKINIPTYDLFPDASYGMSGACALMDVLEHTELDLIHAHYAFPHALSAYLAMDMMSEPALPLVTTLHGSDIFLADEHPCHYNIVKSSLERSTKITAVSSFLKNETKRIFDDDFNMQIIPNFVDTERFRPREDPEGRSEICSDDTCLLVHVSNYRPIKRSSDMVRLLRQMLERGQDTHLLMIGDGPEREHVEGLLGEFHMREHASWVDPVEHVEEYIALGDYLVVTSERESFSMAALEGMACGVPVLNLAQGGVRDLVRDGMDGIHANDRDLYELAGKAIDVFTNSERMEEMKTSARNRVEQSFSEEHVVGEYEKLYRELVRDSSCSST